MTILERLLKHDAWTTQCLMAIANDLPVGDQERKFNIGHRTLRATFVHVIRNMEIWCDLMTARPQRNMVPSDATLSDLAARLEIVSGQLLELGTSVVEQRREEELFLDYLDKPATHKSLGAGLVHIATHGMHHRAQCLYMLRQLGVEDLPEGDVFSWEAAHSNLEESHRDGER